MVALRELIRVGKGGDQAPSVASSERVGSQLVQVAIDQWFRKAMGGDVVSDNSARLVHVYLSPIPIALRNMGNDFQHCEVVGIVDPNQRISLADVSYHPVNKNMSYSSRRMVEQVTVELFPPEFPSPAFIFGIYLSTNCTDSEDPIKTKGVFFLQHAGEPPAAWTFMSEPENVGFPPFGFPPIPMPWRRSISTIRPSQRGEVLAVSQAIF